MAKKRKPGKGNGGKKRKPNYSLPDDDHLDVKPIRRVGKQKAWAEVARLLGYHWDTFSEKDRKAAIYAAYNFGVEFAEEAHKDGEEAYGDVKDYRRVCARFAYKTMKVINDVEYALWDSADPETEPRLAAFKLGFDDWMEKH